MLYNRATDLVDEYKSLAGYFESFDCRIVLDHLIVGFAGSKTWRREVQLHARVIPSTEPGVLVLWVLAQLVGVETIITYIACIK